MMEFVCPTCGGNERNTAGQCVNCVVPTGQAIACEHKGLDSAATVKDGSLCAFCLICNTPFPIQDAINNLRHELREKGMQSK